MEVPMLPDPYIPDYWTPEQALAVFEFLDALRERVWDQYREQIQEQYRIDYCSGGEDNDAQPDLFELDDEIPF
jgi:hypothetical protein